jgi:dynein heavy chain
MLIEIDVVYTALDEGQATINMILGNRYVKVMRSDAEAMKKNLQTLSNALDEWVKVQGQWMYLENIFISSEIKKTLGREAAMFESVDKQYKNLMGKTNKQPNCLRTIKNNQMIFD